jgi:hypothetical protein
MANDGGVIERLKQFIKGNRVLSVLVFRPYTAGYRVYDRLVLEPALEREKEEARIVDAIDCPDNAHIPRVAGAGEIHDGVQTMHNGLRIHVGSYYGEMITQLLQRNGGVHEPQEERVFAAVLPHLPAGATMVELGAYWAFYSMWFHEAVADARCFLLEPDAASLEAGRKNFELNGMAGMFEQAFAGDAEGERAGVPVISVDGFMSRRGLTRIDLLHVDIQGAEVAMLAGAEQALTERRIGYLFISTHSQELHCQCREVLLAHDFIIVADADFQQSFSVDGVLVARSPELTAPAPVAIAQKKV